MAVFPVPELLESASDDGGHDMLFGCVWTWACQSDPVQHGNIYETSPKDNHFGMGLVHSGEAWILAVLGWVWLTLQEMWGFNLLSAHVFYGMLFLTTCNLAFHAFLPDSVGPRSAYFGVVLAFSICTLVSILDTMPVPTLGSKTFEAPGNRTDCTLSKMHQIFLFSNTPVYLAPAGAILGYLAVQLLLAGAVMLDADSRSVWPGPAWGLALLALLSFRLFILFDGSAQGVAGKEVFYYVQLFSEPVWELSALFLLVFEGTLLLLGLEGAPLPKLGQRKFVRYFVMGFVPVAAGGSCIVLVLRGMLTVPTALALAVTILPAIVGTIEAARARPVATPYIPDAPSAPPLPADQAASLSSGRSVFNRPMSQGSRANRYYIPVPVEMVAEKNKGV
jgi:hypothetical protein